ncbi:hypothetical protein A6V36_00375 [Paraburkholderia ginsengiterrae]|uniref:Cytochrome C oxidase assembly protein n=1 Tax=Paraburkholderia ginsengiterrae TaxID=1462993 RepID=A0A1A9NFB7_9BURK|nr:hypothetical protein A6V36_00375 [Paraburkholderia ginsengiterrae]OAJ64835.1 hypothetical protein A6V37_17480 [Paraburkholderia ginsengiterrae]
MPLPAPGSRPAAAASQKSRNVFRKSSMTRNPQERRTPEQIRAGNRRIGLVMFAIAAVFFASVIIKQWFFT